jgi:hypothetical protein
MTAAAPFDTWQLIALAGALGWASGVRLYAVLFIVGGLGYLGWIPLPGKLDLLAHPYVLVASGTMFAIEFFADKIPGIDSLWDFLQTFVRIPAGAALAAGVFGDAPAAWTLAAGIVGGTLATGSHLAKSGSRMAINASPEPFSNWAASFGEDLAVGVMLWLAWVNPIVALVVLALLIVFMVWLIRVVWRFLGAMIDRLRATLGGAHAGADPRRLPP